MKWSLRIGRFAGIDVYLHVTFLIVIGIIALSYWFKHQTVAAALEGTGFFAALFFCVLLHEFGHALMARRFGIRTQDITLLPIGGLARLERIPEKPGQEIAVALAGPAVNLVIAAILYVILHLSGWLAPLNELELRSGLFLNNLMVVNLILVAFNMVPAFPMDGGRVLRAVLALFMHHVTATRIAATIGQGLAILFAIIGFFGPHMLIVIALFVWIGAAQEASLIEVKSLIEGIPVRQAMITEFHSVSPRDTLRHAAQLVMAGSQQDFPVLDDGRFVGVLSRRRLLEGLGKVGLDGSVAEVMVSECERAEADELLEHVLPRVRESQCPMLPVFAGGRLIGLINMENIAELVMIRSALATGRPAAAA